MADNSNKPGSKTGEMLLGLLGTLGTIAGPLVTGRSDVDFGMPFKLGSAYLQQDRMQSDLLKALNSTPHTKDIGADAAHMVQNNLSLPQVLSNPNHLDAFPSQQRASVGQGMELNAPVLSPENTPLPQNIGQTQPVVSPSATIPLPVVPSNDYSSPEFMQQLAKFRPDLAEKAVESQAAKTTDPISQIMKLLTLSNFQTNTQKQQSALEMKQSESDITKKRQEDENIEKTKDNRAKMGVEDIKSREANMTALGHVQSMPNELPGATFMAAAQLYKHGQKAAASLIYPDVARVYEGLQATKIYFASSLKNSRVNPKLLDTLEASFPDPSLNPAIWPVMMKQVGARLRFAGLVKDSELTEAHKTLEGIAPEHGGTTPMNPQDSKDFQSWLTMFNKYGEKALESPTFQALTNKFDLNDLIISIDNKKK